MITVTIDVKIVDRSVPGHPVVERSPDVLAGDALSFLIEDWFNDLFERTAWYIQCLRAEPTVPGATHAYVFSVQSGRTVEQARGDMAMFVSLLGSCVAMLDLPFTAVMRMSFDYGSLIAAGFGRNDRERIDDWLVEKRPGDGNASCRVDFGLSVSRGHLGGPEVLDSLRKAIAGRLEHMAIGTVVPDDGTAHPDPVVSVLLVRPTVVAIAMLTFAILESLDQLIKFSAPESRADPIIVADLVHP